MSNKIAKRIQDEEFAKEISNNYLIYSYYVIANRALPLIADGLKPVQRRILWTMWENKNLNKNPYVKSSKITGQVTGTYHPHGDCYDAMVNIAANYLSLPLIQPQGSWGVVYGDKASQPRYTEARLSIAGELALQDVDTTQMKDNYDSTREEPAHLTPAFPNLIINGAKGIAVGYACEMPEHNPTEAMNVVIAAAKKENYTLTTQEILKIMPGPDFATGGTIIGEDGIKDYIETGTGKFIHRGDAKIVEGERGRHSILITALPRVAANKFIEHIKTVAQDGTLPGIAEIKDLTSKLCGEKGLNIELKLKKGVNPQAMLTNLYAKTPLQTTYNVNNTAINNEGIPVVFSTHEMITIFLNEKMGAILRRTEKQIQKNTKRINNIQTLLTIILDMDAAIKIIRNAETQTQAQTQLSKHFHISKEQAEYVLSLQLRQLTKSDEHKLKTEKNTLEEENTELNRTLTDETYANQKMVKELNDTKKLIQRERKCEILKATVQEITETIKQTQTTHETTIEGPTLYVKDGAGLRLASKEDTNIKETEGGLWATWLDGTAAQIDPLTIGRTPSQNILTHDATPHEQPWTDIAQTPNDKILIITKEGAIKIVDTATLPKTMPNTTTIPTTNNICVQTITKPYAIITTSEGKTLKLDLTKIRAQGRTGTGVAGINLPQGATIIGAFNADNTDTLHTQTNNTQKTTPIADIPEKGRGAGGVVVHAFKKADTHIVEARLGTPEDVEPTPRGKSGQNL